MTDQTVHPDAKRWGGWQWAEPTRGEHFRRCNFCGSIHPEDLAAEEGWKAQWADMKYGWPHKFYVDIPNRDPDQLFVISHVWTDEPPTGHMFGGDWVATEDLTDAQRAVAERDGYLRPLPDGRASSYFVFGTHEHHFGKFYTIHLSDADLAPTVKADIEQRSGLAFTFTSDHVRWRRPGTQSQDAPARDDDVKGTGG